jgi:hypothetical protein
VVVEITQNTLSWLTTQKSVEPGSSSPVQSIPTPVLKARAIVSAQSTTTTTTTQGTDCVLALANDPQAVLVHGTGDLQANCGLSVDGGRDQNVNGTPLGGITFNGSPSQVNITSLAVAASSTGCPSSHCFLFNPSTSPLSASDVLTNTATQDPYAATLNFPTPPSGVQTSGVRPNTSLPLGTNYSNGTRTFTISGCTAPNCTAPAQFTATVSGGKFTSIGAVTDPGVYTVFPTNPVTVTDTTTGTVAKFMLTEGCFTWISGGTPLPGRKYCSINLNGVGAINFLAGSYYVAGGDSGCAGFCVSGGSANVTSDPAGVTFFLTNGDGANSLGTSSYATVTISGLGSKGSIALCAPGTVASGKVCDGTSTQCTGTCMLFVQNPLATTLSANPNGGSCATCNSFSGDSQSVLSGLLYLPRQAFTIQGNAKIGGCFGLIAKYIDVGGTPTFSNGCLPGHGIGGTTTTTTSLSTPYLYQ